MEKNKKVTMRDIASVVGVSQSTVSLVLNGSQSIKLAESTRQKVFDVAQELGYDFKRVTHNAGRPKKIAFIVNGLASYDPFIDAINSAREAAWQEDYILTLFNYGHDTELAAKIELEINSDNYSGVIYASSMTRELDSPRVKTDLPTVLLNCALKESESAPSILPADMIGAYKAVRHLTEQGYRKIAILTGESWMLAATERLDGYRQALIDSNIYPNETYIRQTNWSLKEAHEQTLALITLPNPPEAIFCSSDYIAMGCYQALAKSGLTIGKDIAVVGYDNQQIASEISPSLTTIDLPYGDMGKQAVETLINLFNQQPILSNRMKIEGELIVRESSVKA